MFVSCTVQQLLDNFYKHVLQLMSALAMYYTISNDNPLPIQFKQPTRGGLVQSWFDQDKLAYAKTHTSVDRIELDPI